MLRGLAAFSGALFVLFLCYSIKFFLRRCLFSSISASNPIEESLSEMMLVLDEKDFRLAPLRRREARKSRIAPFTGSEVVARLAK